MAEPITMQQLGDAGADVDTLEAAVNEDKMITARLGREYASVPMASRLLVENGLLGARPFSTYAKMTAPDVDPPLVDGNYAVVTNDGALGANGVYEKVDGVWVYLKYNKKSSAGGALWFKTLSSTVVNFDKETRILSWSSEILTPTQLRADGRIILEAHTLQFTTDNYQVAWIDLRDINKPDFSAATSVKISTYNLTEAEPFNAREYQLPLFYYSKGVGSAVAGFFEDELMDFSSVLSVVDDKDAASLDLAKDYADSLLSSSYDVTLSKTSVGAPIWFKVSSLTKVSFDTTTRVLSWSDRILAPTNLSAVGRVILEAHTLQFTTDNYQVAWIDLRDINKPDFSAATSVKISTYNLNDTEPFNAKYYQLPIFFFGWGLGRPASGFFEDELTNKVLSTSTKTRFKKDSATKMSIYQKGRNKNFIEFNFEHEVNAYNPTNAFGNLDCWRIKGAWECNQNLGRILEIAQGGAWEMAIREKGVEDSVGTYHGDEILKSAYFVIDGRVYLDASLFDVINPASFEFVQESDLYRCNTQTKIAKVLRRYEWQDNGFVLTQRIEWIAAVTVQDAWLAMIPSYRKSDNGNGAQVTDSVMRTLNGVITRETNMGVPDFEMVDTPFYDGDIAKLWGSASGIAFDLEVIESPNLPEQTLHFSNAPVYNKFYFDVTGYRKNDYLTAIGEVWKCKAKFGVYTAN